MIKLQTMKATKKPTPPTVVTTSASTLPNRPYSSGGLPYSNLLWPPDLSDARGSAVPAPSRVAAVKKSFRKSFPTSCQMPPVEELPQETSIATVSGRPRFEATPVSRNSSFIKRPSDISDFFKTRSSPIRPVLKRADMSVVSPQRILKSTDHNDEPFVLKGRTPSLCSAPPGPTVKPIKAIKALDICGCKQDVVLVRRPVTRAATGLKLEKRLPKRSVSSNFVDAEASRKVSTSSVLTKRKKKKPKMSDCGGEREDDSSPYSAQTAPHSSASKLISDSDATPKALHSIDFLTKEYLLEIKSPLELFVEALEQQVHPNTSPDDPAPKPVIKMGLDRMNRIAKKARLQFFNNYIFLVGGTNGKGSTVRALECLLLAAGYHVGCFTSPKLLGYEELIRIDGSDVDSAEYLKWMEYVEKLIHSADDDDEGSVTSTSTSCDTCSTRVHDSSTYRSFQQNSLQSACCPTGQPMSAYASDPGQSGHWLISNYQSVDSRGPSYLKQLASATATIRPDLRAPGDRPTVFEHLTLAALCLFRSHQELDVLILEIGMGGEGDAVNWVEPDMSIVTNVGIDHTAFLGETREAIGRIKASIFRPGKIGMYGDRLGTPNSMQEYLDRNNVEYFRLYKEWWTIPEWDKGTWSLEFCSDRRRRMSKSLDDASLFQMTAASAVLQPGSEPFVSAGDFSTPLRVRPGAATKDDPIVLSRKGSKLADSPPLTWLYHQFRCEQGPPYSLSNLTIPSQLPLESVSLALAALVKSPLRLPLTRDILDQTINSMQLLGRYQKVYIDWVVPIVDTEEPKHRRHKYRHHQLKRRLFLLDVAHNGHGAKWLAGRLRRDGLRDMDCIFGAFPDKQISEMLSALSDRVGMFYCCATQPNTRRGDGSLEVVVQQCSAMHLRYQVCGSVSEALRSTKATNVLCCGSFYVVGECLKLLTHIQGQQRYHEISSCHSRTV
eukprot:Blabericola_migrator_1__2865@NODE_181_length_11864_cov_121_034161_g157_i0_p2_GENE_NODE_181_length_11864_cov_121_034161_g157_i0NODE_181_length_11864_cov_121_034161_g157_i0_p2_ORF_typecomplete_len947_score86_87Mur_ligase_M/PF08245_12/4_4e20GBP_repeat/PF02526_14/2_5e02GBP_repeat/PF02526_14/4_2e03GBP_repeat/PF02526_14/0_58zfC2HCIx2C/PF10782_9/0_34_NODE_181_length_11864_cov_121_034161_g157_i0202860